MPLGNVFDEFRQPLCIPSIRKHGCLKDLVQNRAIDKGGTGVISSFDPVLEHGTTSTTEWIGYNCGREEMVGMQDQKVVVVVNEAPSTCIKDTDNMNERFGSNWSLDPGASKMDKSHCLHLLSLEKQDLYLG